MVAGGKGMTEFRALTKEDLEVYEQLAKTNISQPINPELKYVVTGRLLINMLNKMAELHILATSPRSLK